ncbi:hypothetical protein NSQ91_25875 [Paenibacillus sp. FSL R7-0048]|uniref:hypothetical protein n=1 Tax=Paenibacillus sp. FSL R7-0048 TaxID=2954528 RepID=UPI00096E1F9F|nr:hypothetical protein BSK48_28665 [Paenibacillus odorifer]
MGKHVAKVAGHLEYITEAAGHLEYIAEVAWAGGERITEIAWRVGEASYWRESAINYVAAAYDLKTNWSVEVRSA